MQNFKLGQSRVHLTKCHRKNTNLHVVRSTEVEVDAKTKATEARNYRRYLASKVSKDGSYNRRVVDDEKSIQQLDDDGVGYSRGGLIAQMRSNNFSWTQGDVTVKLADAYGYCWGVERAVQMAYEARNKFPTETMYITNELIHNPNVNNKMREMGIEIIKDEGEGKDFAKISKGDVVIFPAFGASFQEMKELHEKGANLVDTTCPWVAKVWNSVEKQAVKEYTSVIHGKWQHEETLATASFAGHYIIVKTLKEAQYVIDYILKGGDRKELLEKFKNAISEGFDPDLHLDKVGLANQTTMLKDETQEIGKMFERTMMQKFGPENLKDHFMIQDTICDATQERQDAMYDLTGKQETAEKLDMMVIVGGLNSSNTSHLQEIGEIKDIPSFWVDSADRIDIAANKIMHKTSWGELKETSPWLPEGKLSIGVSSGASTPDKNVEDVLEKVFRIKDPNFKGVQKQQLGGLVVERHEMDDAEI